MNNNHYKIEVYRNFGEKYRYLEIEYNSTDKLIRIGVQEGLCGEYWSTNFLEIDELDIYIEALQELRKSIDEEEIRFEGDNK